MKNLGKLKLNQLNKAEIEKREMLNLKGGDCGGGHSGCHCGCMYEGSNGSSTWDNLSANLDGGIVSSCHP